MINSVIYNNLLSQFERVYKHNRQGSIRTKHRYKEAFIRFVAFLAEVYRLEKLGNISDKHLRSCVDNLLDRRLEISYIKVELSAIRFLLTKFPAPSTSCPPTRSWSWIGVSMAKLTVPGATANTTGRLNWQ